MQNSIEHGISVGISRINNFFMIKIKIIGTLTHNDYEKMVPMLRDAIHGVKEANVKVLMDATEFDGWELRAAWDDFKFGVEFRDKFSKIAFVGTKAWEEYSVKIGNWFVSGEMKFFNSLRDAYAWLSEDEIEAKTPVEKDLKNRKDEIEDDLESLFTQNLKIVDWNVPEADNQKSAEILINILEDKLREIKEHVASGRYK